MSSLGRVLSLIRLPRYTSIVSPQPVPVELLMRHNTLQGLPYVFIYTFDVTNGVTKANNRSREPMEASNPQSIPYSQTGIPSLGVLVTSKSKSIFCLPTRRASKPRIACHLTFLHLSASRQPAPFSTQFRLRSSSRSTRLTLKRVRTMILQVMISARFSPL